MDFLDYIESHRNRKWSRQMRAWYLYEQYKALEMNQREAALQLNDKMFQSVMVHREVSEHRQRRQMCNVCHSEPSLDFTRYAESSSCVACSINDLYESICDIHDDDIYSNFGSNAEHLTDNASELCQSNQNSGDLCDSDEQFNTVEDINEPKKSNGDAEVSVESIPHVVLNESAVLIAASSRNLADDIKEELEYVKKTIEENIHLQLEMKEDVHFSDYSDPQDLHKLEFEEKTSLGCEDDTPNSVDDIIDSDHKSSFINLAGEPLNYLDDIKDGDLKNCYLNLGAVTLNYLDDIKNGDHKICSLNLGAETLNYLDDIKNGDHKICSLNLGAETLNYLDDIKDGDHKNCFLNLGVETSNYLDDIKDDDNNNSSLEFRSVSEKVQAINYNMLWTKFVSFAYQVVKLNYGNCCYDYSAQFMTAVLACEVLRRGISGMCNVLQPYVSPIKFVSYSAPSINDSAIKKVNIKPPQVAAKSKTSLATEDQRQYNRNYGLSETYYKTPGLGEETFTKNTWPQRSSHSSRKKKLSHNEAWRRFSNRSNTSVNYSSTFLEDSDSKVTEFKSCSTRVANPMLKLATYIDSVLQNSQ